jgi:hypothetical protein
MAAAVGKSPPHPLNAYVPQGCAARGTRSVLPRIAHEHARAHAHANREPRPGLPSGHKSPDQP